jgi:hypothetical protein
VSGGRRHPKDRDRYVDQVCPGLRSAARAALAGGAKGQDLRVLLAVVDLTAGWCRSWDRVSRAEIAEVAGMSPVHVSRSLANLKALGALEWEPGGIDADGRKTLSTVRLPGAARGTSIGAARGTSIGAAGGTRQVPPAAHLHENPEGVRREGAAGGHGGAATTVRPWAGQLDAATAQRVEFWASQPDSSDEDLACDPEIPADRRADAVAAFERCRASLAARPHLSSAPPPLEPVAEAVPLSDALAALTDRSKAEVA